MRPRATRTLVVGCILLLLAEQRSHGYQLHERATLMMPPSSPVGSLSPKSPSFWTSRRDDAEFESGLGVTFRSDVPQGLTPPGFSPTEWVLIGLIAVLDIRRRRADPER